MLEGKGIRFSLGFENLDYDKMDAKLKEDLIAFSNEYGLEFGAYEDNTLYMDGEIVKNTRQEAKSKYTSVKKELRNLLKKYDKSIKLIEELSIFFTRL